jgi:hypothetical protein
MMVCIKSWADKYTYNHCQEPMQWQFVTAIHDEGDETL